MRARPFTTAAHLPFALLALLSAGCPGRVDVGGDPGDLSVSTDDLGVVAADDLSMLSTPDAQEDVDATPPPDLNPGCATLPGNPVRITGNLSVDTTFTCNTLYLLAGTVIVDSNATLTIERGTTVLMANDGSLVITPGAKLNAIGTRDLPIVFTSAKLPDSRMPGDWGSVILVGKAPGNWGRDSSGNVITSARADANDWPGADASDRRFPISTGVGSSDDSSGTLTYVRLEYGGIPRNEFGQSDHEMLGLYGVGSGTTLEYIDMRQANFECLFSEGGAFNARHLACQWSGNGGFGFSRGNQSKVQFLSDQESPYKEAEGVGIKGPFDGNLLAPRTDPTIYNVTVCGTNGSPATVKDPWGVFIRRNAAGKIYDLIATGFKAGAAMTGGAGGVATTELHSSIFYGNFDSNQPSVDTNIWAPATVSSDTNLDNWFHTSGWLNSTANPMLPDCFNTSSIHAAPASAITTNAATPPNDGFFDPNARYLGAFKDQTDGWASGAWIQWSPK